jgi:hypothetical protein
MLSDGCTHWFDGTWRHCCEAHDLAYSVGAVTLQTHIDLGTCVVHAGGGLLMGIAMAVATAIWWAFRRRA